MSPETLRRIMPDATLADCVRFAQPLADAMKEFQIDTLGRRSAFLAQVAHESGSLRYVKELASGQAYDVGAKAVALGNTPVDDDDGEKYKGRGLLQITGRANYAACGAALGLALVLQPELLEQPLYAARSAAWFWSTKNLNELADNNRFGEITKRINGGYTHLDERLKCWLVARKALGL